MTIPGSANPLLMRSAAPTAYQVERSLRFNSSDSAYCSRTPASAGNRRTWTFSAWVKRSGLSTATGLFAAGSSGSLVSVIFLNIDGKIWYYDYNGTFTTKVETASVYRDFSAWYHIVVALDTTQATAANRVRIYVNGSEVTTFSTATYPSQNFDTQISTTTVHTINKESDFYANYGNQYLADIHFIDGQALTPSSFTEVSATTGQLIPKAYTGSYGTNGFRLPFSDNSGTTATTLGKDAAGSNNWTPNNFSVTAGAGNDSLVDSPTSYGTDTGAGGEVRGNYCTWNPLRSLASLLNGNLDHSNITTGFEGSTGTIYVSTGKWYWEWLLTSAVSDTMIGIATNDHPLNSNYSASSTSWTYFSANGQKYGNGANGVGYGAAWANGDLIGIALDMDAGTITFYKNGASQGVAFNTGIQGKTVTPLISGFNTTGVKGSANFGQRPFAYPAPSGFKALCTTNLPTPTIANGATAMDVKLYTGNGSTQTISGLNFSPDLVWYKQRNAAAKFHRLYDTVRGVTTALRSDSTNAEESISGLTAFTSEGFTVGADPGGNELNGTYVAWCWDAGSSTVTNTQGSITSQVRANASAGFSVVGWNYPIGSPVSTIGHGLGVKPSFIIIKTRDNSSNWIIYHTSTGATKCFRFNTAAASTETDPFNNTEPTSSVFTIGSGSWWGGGNMIAYCFAPVAGYSSFGSYTGNGSSDGPFVFTGFRPKFLMLKRSDSTGGWYMFDTSREPFNLVNDFLIAHSSGAEQTYTFGDITSNGFKLRDNSADWNASGGTILYAAFAESPFQYARAR